jgi:hypothetical protein
MNIVTSSSAIAEISQRADVRFFAAHAANHIELEAPPQDDLKSPDQGFVPIYRVAQRIASNPLRRMTFNRVSAGPFGCLAPRSNCDTYPTVRLRKRAKAA